MEFKKKILDNGLVIVGETNKAAKSAAVGFFVKTGSRDETQEISGVSHFLEHMLFKGTDKLSAAEVNESFDKTGAQFNAFTSEENTVFYAAVLPEYLEEITRLWSQLMRPALRDEDFNLEKNVIKEEIAMYKDMPSFDVMDRCRTLYFGEHPGGNSVLGSDESIDDLTAEQMRKYFASRYAPNNITLCCAGNFEWDLLCSIAEENCGYWKERTVERNVQNYGGIEKKQRIAKPNLSREHICLMSPAVAATDQRRFAASLLTSIIGDDTGSRFFWELVDKAIAETASMQFGPMDGTGAFYSYIRCSKENAAKAMAIVEDVFAGVAQKGVTKEELEKAKNKILSGLVIKNEVSMGRLVDLGFNWVYAKEYQPIEDDIKAVKVVTVDDIRALIEQFQPAHFTQFAIGPQ